MTDLPNAAWVSFNGKLVKAGPERVGHTSPEEDLTISGWLRGISRVRVEFEQVPKKGFVDITADQDPLEDPGGNLPMEDPDRRAVICLRYKCQNAESVGNNILVIILLNVQVIPQPAIRS